MLPFVIAFILAYIVRKVADKIRLVTGLSTKAGGFVCLLSVYSIIIVSLFFAIRFATRQIVDFFIEFPSVYEGLIEPRLQSISLYFSQNLSMEIKQFFSQAIDSLGSFVMRISAGFTSWAAGIILKIPEIVFSVFITVLSSFFICFDYHNIKSFIIKQLPSNILLYIRKIKEVFINCVFKMFICYLIMFLITFAQLFVGISLLGVDNSLIIALFIALADALPMIGVGVVLIPWAVVSFINSNIYLGAGLFALFFITVVVRNIIEPKIIGKKMGIHPLLSLATAYIGVKCGSFLIAIILLLLIVIIKHLNQSGELKFYR